MKEEKFTRKDGSKGTTYRLEAGDKVTSRYDEVRENISGEFTNYSLGVETLDKKEVHVRLTQSQTRTLKKSDKLKGKLIEAYEYENEYGKQVGVKVI